MAGESNVTGRVVGRLVAVSGATSYRAVSLTTGTREGPKCLVTRATSPL